jgi:DNA-binding MarR family transcriptional regulator
MTTGDRSELINRVLELHRRFFHIMSEDDEPEAWLALNLTIAQLKSLIFVRAEGPTNSKTLAAVMRVTPPDVTRIIDRLVEQGLMSREENPDNRRMQILKVTDKGEELLKRLRERGPKRMSGILKLMSIEELSALYQGLSALIRAAVSDQSQPQESTR